jgi:DNA-binding transcriptional ArsR family regulator
VSTYGPEALGALGDPTRRAIFECLVRQPMAVGQISALLPVSRPAVSQHLKVLKQAGLVTDHADGTRRIYQVNPAGVHAMRAYLDETWNRAMASFQIAAQQVALSESQGSGNESQEQP